MDWTALDRRGDGPSRKSLLKSFLLHSLLLVAFLISPLVSPEPLQFESFQIEIVSGPPADVSEAPLPTPDQEEVVVETPDPEPPQPEVEETPPPPDPEEDTPVEEEEEETPPEEEEPPTPTPPPTDTAPPSADTAATEEDASGADVNVRLEGLKQDYPLYYESIIAQIQACWRPPRGAGRLTTVVYFEIRRDGTVSDIRFVERSGDPTFDYEARGAVECAGAGRFGPLPEDLPYDRLPVQFTFEPRGEGAP